MQQCIKILFHIYMKLNMLLEVWTSLSHKPAHQTAIYRYRVTYTRCRTDTINSPVDGHMAARNT